MAGPENQANGINHNEITNVLASEGVKFLLSSDGKVPLSSCEGKSICLYFSANWCRPCRNFTPQLVKFYENLRLMGKRIEIIFISFDRDENGFEEHYKGMPWLAVPYDVNLHKRLSSRYGVNRIPSLIPLDVDILSVDGDPVELIEEYGSEAFPLTRKRREELKAIDNAKREGGDLVELLTREGREYVISRYGRKIAASELVGKTIGLYFGAHWSPPSRAFTAQLIEAYNGINASKGQHFEVVFVSTDRNHEEFEVNVNNMPWFAIPYKDKTRQDLCRIFSINGIPTLVLIGPDGKTISRDGRAMISLYSHLAFPFTESRIGEIEAFLKKEGETFPNQVKDIKHEHLLTLDRAKAYVCDSCKKQGRFWVFSCGMCNYDVHPTCLEEAS